VPGSAQDEGPVRFQAPVVMAAQRWDRQAPHRMVAAVPPMDAASARWVPALALHLASTRALASPSQA